MTQSAPPPSVAASAAVIALDEETQREKIAQLETQQQFALLEQLWITISSPIDHFPMLTALRSLNIQFEQTGHLENAQLMSLLNACSRLEELSIAASRPSILDENIFSGMRCPMQHLALFDVDITDTHLQIIAQKWRESLKTFIVTVAPFRSEKIFTGDGMRNITNHCSGLITFECNGDSYPSVSPLVDTTFYGAKILHLVELCVDGNPYVTDSILDYISLNCVALTRLSVSATNVTFYGVFRTALHFPFEVLCCDRISKQPMDATTLRAIGLHLAPSLVHFEAGFSQIADNDAALNEEVIVFAMRCSKLATFGPLPRHLHDRVTIMPQLSNISFKVANYPNTPTSVSSKFGGSRLGQPVGVTNFRFTKRV